MNFAAVTNKPPDELFRELKTGPRGLTHDQAAKRLAESGPNELKSKELRWWDVWLRQFHSSFVYLLLIAAGTAFALKEITEGVLMLVFVLINTTLGFFQEFQSERALQTLKKFLARLARVWRDGKEIAVERATLVPGDVVILAAGDQVPADVRILEARDLTVNESILTGEAAPVEKIALTMSWTENAIHKAKNIGFLGTTVVTGKGLGLVISTGSRTAMGEIGKLTAETHRQGQFEKQVKSLSSFVMRLVVISLALLFIANIAIKGRSANIPELFIFSLVLVVSLIPEALSVVTTITLSRGALKLAKHKVVVKRLASIEDLGSIEILCTDKTGTITENKMTVAEVEAEDKKQCLIYAALATSKHESNPFGEAVRNRLDEGERAKLKEYKYLSDTPFDPRRRRQSVLLQHVNGRELLITGAPETLMDCCAHTSAKHAEELTAWMKVQGEQGRRVIAVAKKTWHGESLEHGAHDETGATLLGLVSFDDPLKPTARHAIKQAESLGLKIKILTGDRPEVAAAVAHQIGLIASPAEVITGDELEKLPADEREKAAEKFHVFARVSPEQKYLIVQLLQRQAEVGFIGEGINDAPALKLANVGLVVQGASDLARDAADVVLLQKSLDVMVGGIKQGRLVYANILKYIQTALTSNFGNFYSIAIIALFLPFLPMLPVQALLLNLFSDFPMLAISTDTVKTRELRRPRHNAIKDMLMPIAILGAVNMLFDLVFYGSFHDAAPAVLQTNWFIFNILTEVALIYSLRASGLFYKASRPSWQLVALSVVILIISLSLPYLFIGQTFFSFVPPQAGHLVGILFLVACYFAATEIVKTMYAKQFVKVGAKKI